MLYYNCKINVILSIANVQSNVKEVCKIQKTILVAYYSQTGQTKKFAEMIAKMTNADVYEIVPVRKYNDDMWKAWDEAQIERAENKYPALRGGLPDISKYDTVIIGGGVWGFTLANPIFSFMKAMDFAGKKCPRSGHSTTTMKSTTTICVLKQETVHTKTDLLFREA